ncbi:phospholipid carrier-dependent glycosyltransferase [Georgenia sp. TF02-10]|uniref:dolichyl-phosphate-mannose--protein mannosyltransferase n=1 Tax=Georgenia sp. TF02-10 TaxID=2917725 RepID=UPI001FA7C96C|nr:phospholipid carrier-dependent glycosyltransferase [Georgenia sp. TF02-10]UNX55535.1 phospholipid carrier-dependent glycosyltransferase [Georgenia sp. TF02-10]
MSTSRSAPTGDRQPAGAGEGRAPGDEVFVGEEPAASEGTCARQEPATNDQPPTEAELRTRLGLPARPGRPDPAARLWGWLGPLAVTVLAAVLRLVQLNHPGRLVFDETYYVKQAYSLLTLGYEGEWAEDSDAAFAAGDDSGLSTTADYVVHPAVGKWMIAIGLRLFGADNGLGWRFSAAVVGALSVLLLARVATRLFGSALLGTTAGLLLAVDGVHLTESRTALLDVFLSFWVLVGFWCVLHDRSATRAVLARRAAATARAPGAPHPWGPRTGPRWWLVAAGVALGLACGVKWSGIYAVAVFGLLVLGWDLAARRAVGARLWVGGGIFRGGLPAFVALVPTAALTYVLTWASWFAHPAAYRRQWASDLRAAGHEVPRDWLPDALNSWWEYHLTMWQFHNNLDADHPYQANPAGWLLQLRPTSFYWPDPAPPPSACGADKCVQAILSVGNPVLWWAAAVALLALVYLAVRRRDWRAWAVLAGYAAMYLPWLGYTHRTIFTFYTVAVVPYVVLCLTFVLGWAAGVVRPPVQGTRTTARGQADDLAAAAVPPSGGGTDVRSDAAGGEDVPPADGRAAPQGGAEVSPAMTGASAEAAPPARPGWRGRAQFLVSDDGDVRLGKRAWLLGAVVLAALAAAAFFWPVWTGETISYDAWRWRMWLPSWI